MRSGCTALAMTDDLTGLHNLRSFEARLAPMVRDARESGTPFVMLVLDVDRLKSLNDRYGHLTGADAVRTVGRILAARVAAGRGRVPLRRRRVRDRDPAVQPHGGPMTWPTPSAAECTRRRRCSRGFPFPLPRCRSASAWRRGRGAPALATDHDAGEALFRAADAALYRAKACGRNHVCVA